MPDEKPVTGCECVNDSRETQSPFPLTTVAVDTVIFGSLDKRPLTQCFYLHFLISAHTKSAKHTVPYSTQESLLIHEQTNFQHRHKTQCL